MFEASAVPADLCLFNTAVKEKFGVRTNWSWYEIAGVKQNYLCRYLQSKNAGLARKIALLAYKGMLHHLRTSKLLQ